MASTSTSSTTTTAAARRYKAGPLPSPGPTATGLGAAAWGPMGMYYWFSVCSFLWVGRRVCWEGGGGRGGGEGYLLCCGDLGLFSKLCVFDW